MRYCDLTLTTPAENLACDEALLDSSEATQGEEILRFWSPAQYFVVLGYANKQATEVNLDFCRAHDIPVLRRCSGGGTVLQGPGCLNYTLILRIARAPSRQSIPAMNEEVLQKHRVALSTLLTVAVHKEGHTDLVAGALKFSGNAQRRGRNYLLFHGAFLLNFDLGLIEKTLPMPSHQPAYRADRSHVDFLMNLHLPAAPLKAALARAWKADQPLSTIPFERITRLVSDKYSQAAWNSKF